MSTEKHEIAEAGVEHDMPEHIPSRCNDLSKSARGKGNKPKNEREIPIDVMPDWEEL
jgi:hypothetical protein